MCSATGTSYSVDLFLLSAQRRPVHRFISVSKRTTHPTHGLPHPAQGHTTFHLRLKEEPHTHLMGTPNSWTSSPHTRVHNVPSPSQRGWAHPTHTVQYVSWRMSCNHQHELGYNPYRTTKRGSSWAIQNNKKEGLS
jgi:hypothetical protein